MKVAIVSTPRTCSSILGGIFAKKYNLTDMSEIFTSAETSDDAANLLETLKTTDNYVVKITTTSLTDFTDVFQYNTFPWEIFDKIVLTERTNKLQQVASWLALNTAQKSGKKSALDINQFVAETLGTDVDLECDTHQINNIVNNINFYYDNTKPHLLSLNLPTCVVTHELMQLPKDEVIIQLNQILNETVMLEDIDNSIQSNIDYTSLIVKYELEKLISEL